MATTPRCGLLDLPVEIRLMIYDLALQDSTEITIATVLDESADASGRARWKIPGLPDNHVPVTRNGFDEKIMDFSSFAPQNWTQPLPLQQPGTPSCSGRGTGTNTPMSIASSINTPSLTPGLQLAQAIESFNITGSYFTLPVSQPKGEPEFSPYSLLATCRQIHEELDDHLGRRRADPLTLHVSYPYGILVLRHMYPSLLKTARTINIGGFFTGEWSGTDYVDTPNTFGSPTRALPPKMSEITELNLHGPTTPSIAHDTAKASAAALKAVLRAVTHQGLLLPHVHAITLRTFTPRSTDYKIAMYCDSSPTTIATQGVGLALIETWAWRARGGCSWVVKIRPCLNGRESRWVSNSWPVWSDGREDWIRLITGAMALPKPLDWGVSVID